jgi:hypothetical protein
MCGVACSNGFVEALIVSDPHAVAPTGRQQTATCGPARGKASGLHTCLCLWLCRTVVRRPHGILGVAVHALTCVETRGPCLCVSVPVCAGHVAVPDHIRPGPPAGGRTACIDPGGVCQRCSHACTAARCAWLFSQQCKLLCVWRLSKVSCPTPNHPLKPGQRK